jgi:hypothetical protein
MDRPPQLCQGPLKKIKRFHDRNGIKTAYQMLKEFCDKAKYDMRTTTPAEAAKGKLWHTTITLLSHGQAARTAAAQAGTASSTHCTWQIS